VNAILLLEAGQDGEDGAWVLAPVAGLPLALRAVLTLAAGGAKSVTLACGAREAAAISPHLDAWRRRRGMPTVTQAEGSVERFTTQETPLIVADGRYFFTATDVRRALEAGPHDAEVQEAGSAAAASSPFHPEPIHVGMKGRDIDLTTVSGRHETKRRLLAGLHKPTDGWFARRLNRPLSLRLSSRLAGLPFSPSFYTAVTFAVGAAAGVVSAFGGYWNLLAGGILFQAASVLDGVDGEIARLTFRCSRTGERLDSISDDLTNVVYLTGLTIGVYRDTGLRVLALLGAAAVGLDLLTRVVLYTTLVLKGLPVTLVEYESRLRGLGARATPLERLVAWIAPMAKRDLQAWLAFAFAAAGAAWLTLVLWAVGAVVGAPVVLTRVRRLAFQTNTHGP